MLDKTPGVASAINILNASTIADERLQELSRAVGRSFGLRTYVSPAPLNLDWAFDAYRGQYNSTALLVQLVNAFAGGDEKSIAVVGVDLFIPVLTFVFGEAQLGGSAAVVSTHRLANPFYGLPKNDELSFQRLKKEVVHELGHTFGLYHCRQFECVMRSSTYVEEIDLKRVVLCNECAATLHSAR
ncbi:MAG: archaemetzincin family Zn-dependent metalloprotease [Ignavibacteria bacterium]|nr:archaemetzincin family Zn-dependent metalloprotease [Ignavibacteria bacterium]